LSKIDEMLEFNKKFVEEKQYKIYPITKYPTKKIAVLSCMDTRLTEILPAALNFRNGDIKIIKNAGAVITHPFGSVMRSLMIAIYELGIEDILVIGHKDCGMQGMDSSKLISKIIARGIEKEKIDIIKRCGVDLDKWLKGFDSVEDSILATINTIRQHPLIPQDMRVHGFIIDPETGKLDRINEPDNN